MDLQKKRLGRTGLYVTTMGMGTYQITGDFGVHYNEAQKILGFALRSGINYIDTAQTYGAGESEALVGQALRKYGDKGIIISDKFGYPDRCVTRDMELKAYQDPVAIKRVIKYCFWLLQRDYVDIFMIHEPNFKDWWQFNYETGDCVAMTVLEELKKEGIIGAIGLGCWSSETLRKLCDTGRFDVALNAGGLTIFNRPMFDSKLMDVCAKHDIGVVVGGVLAQGAADELFTIRNDIAEKLVADENPAQRLKGLKLRKFYDLCNQSGIPILDLSLRYALSFDGIHSHIPGARLEAHIKQNLEISKKGPLPSDVVEKIIEISKLTI